jgi:hypothetical protein
MTLSQLFSTKAFWFTLIDVLAAMINLLGQLFWPKYVDLVWQVWLILQPLAALLIGSLAVNEIVVPTLRAAKLF